MELAEDIDSFRVWATNMGCPPDALPNEEALKSIFKSRQRQLFLDLQKLVQPRQIVQELRENVLIKQMELHKGKMVPACNRNFLPKEMQTYLEIQELKKQKEAAELTLKETKTEFDTLAATIKTKNIQSISAEHKREVLESKYNILQFKYEHLCKAIKQEEDNKNKILATMPVKFGTQNACEEKATKSVEQALKELEFFYNICNDCSNNSQTLQEAKQNLWQRMRKIFASVPNFFIFNAIMKLKEEQLQHIMQMNKTRIGNSSISMQKHKESLDTFELKLLKTKGEFLGMVAKYLSARNELAHVEEKFSDVYVKFVDELEKKVKNFNVIADEKVAEEIISEYLVQYTMRNFNKARNEFITNQIEQYCNEIEIQKKQLENHEVLLGSVKEVYAEINTSVNRIQYELLQLDQIKDKILYSKNMMKNMLDDMKTTTRNANAKNNFLTTKLKINMNISQLGAESFDVGNDSVFCSTKLDFDPINTTLRRSFGGSGVGGSGADTTLMAIGRSCGGDGAANTATLPGHLMELNTFAEIPLEKFSCISPLSAYYLSPNPLIIESRELASTVQLAPGLLLTPFGALQEIARRILWALAITAQTHDLKLNLDMVIVDTHELKSKAKKQREHVSQLMDNIDVTAVNTKLTLQKMERLFKFIVNNPMRHFIPKTKLFNNLTYAEYESEFSLYYRMATLGGSIK